MGMSKKDINHLMIKIAQCSGRIGYEIALKEDKGYDVSELESKLLYLDSLRSIVENAPCACKKKLTGNVIHFCSEKVLLSKRNPLYLTDNIDSRCSESQMAEKYCIDLCEVESKVSSICINC